MAIEKFNSVWLGLASYTENDRSLFFGRTSEIEKLKSCIEDGPLCILYGPSGTGKTSLLQAGVFPRLRPRGWLPVSVRLDHSEVAKPYAEQVIEAIRSAAEQSRLQVEEICDSLNKARPETLWEWLHRHTFKNVLNKTISPVLVIDQFEELFTLASDNRKSDAWFAELADLATNNVPSSVVEEMMESEVDFGFSADEQPWRLVISLREDFLPRLEEKTEQYPVFRQNRMSIAAFGKEQALEVVLGPGCEIVTEDVATEIVELVGRSTTGKLGKIDPALLSLFCSRLDLRRQKQGLQVITKDLLLECGDSILQAFYVNASSLVSPETMRLLEEHLLTTNGFRASWAIEDAESAGVSREAWSRLVEARLLHIDHRGGVQWLEYSHDVLTAIARKQIDDRNMQKESAELRKKLIEQRNRNRRTAFCCFILLGLIGVVVTFAFWALKAERDTREKNRQLEYMNFVNEFVSEAQSFETELGKSQLYELLNNTNMFLTANTPNSTQGFVRKFLKDDGTKIAGPKTTLMMLKAMLYHPSFNLELSMNQCIRLSQAMIYLGDKKARIYCEMATISTNSTLTAERINALEQELKKIDADEKKLESYVKMLDMKIGDLRDKLEKKYRQDKDDGVILSQANDQIRKMIKEWDYRGISDVVRRTRMSGDDNLINSMTSWILINNSSINHKQKLFYSQLYRNREIKEAEYDSQKSLMVAIWDMRIAGLYGEIGRFSESAKYIDHAVYYLSKYGFCEQEFFQSDCSCIGDIYADIDVTLIEQFFKTKDERAVADDIHLLCFISLVEKVLSFSGVSMRESYFPMYLHGKKDDFLKTYDFHNKLCDFVSKSQNDKVVRNIRDLLSRFKGVLNAAPLDSNGRGTCKGGLMCRGKDDDNLVNILIWDEAIKSAREFDNKNKSRCIEMLRRRNSRFFSQSLLDFLESDMPLSLKGLVVCAYNEPLKQHAIFKIGDVITAIDGKPCANYKDFHSSVDSIYTIYRRNNKGGFDKITERMPKDQPSVLVLEL